jgi:hypothetical protein
MNLIDGDRITVYQAWYTVCQVTGNSVRVYETNRTFHVTHITRHVPRKIEVGK